LARNRDNVSVCNDKGMLFRRASTIKIQVNMWNHRNPWEHFLADIFLPYKCTRMLSNITFYSQEAFLFVKFVLLYLWCSVWLCFADQCIVCPSIYGFWLPLWCLQTLLEIKRSPTEDVYYNNCSFFYWSKISI